MPVRIDPGRAREVANQYDASWEDVAIRAFDSAPLRGWLFTPRQPNRRAVLFVHGRGGTRQHMLVRSQWFLRAGYTCLLIDQRGSGASGGVFSFGIPSFARVRLRHGLDLTKAASGPDAIRTADVPVLIVQGSDDRDTPLSGAERLRDANPSKVELVIIPGADHEWFSSGRPEVLKRVLTWFDAHAPSL